MSQHPPISTAAGINSSSSAATTTDLFAAGVESMGSQPQGNSEEDSFSPLYETKGGGQPPLRRKIDEKFLNLLLSGEKTKEGRMRSQETARIGPGDTLELYTGMREAQFRVTSVTEVAVENWWDLDYRNLGFESADACIRYYMTLAWGNYTKESLAAARKEDPIDLTKLVLQPPKNPSRKSESEKKPTLRVWDVVVKSAPAPEPVRKRSQSDPLQNNSSSSTAARDQPSATTSLLQRFIIGARGVLARIMREREAGRRTFFILDNPVWSTTVEQIKEYKGKEEVEALAGIV